MLSLLAPVAIAPISRAYAEQEVKSAADLQKEAETKKSTVDSKFAEATKKWAEWKKARGSKKTKLKTEAETLDKDHRALKSQWESLVTQTKTTEETEKLAATAKAQAEKLAQEKQAELQKKLDEEKKAQDAVDAEEKTPVKVSSSDLEDAEVSVKLTSGSIKLDGKLPKACADRLMLGNVKKSENVKDLKGSKITQEKELADYTRVYELEVQFNTSKSFPSLEDCLKTQKGNGVIELTSDAHSKKIKKDASLAVIKFIDEDESTAIESDALKSLKSKLANFNCENCSQDLDSVKATLSSTKNDSILKTAREALMDKALLEIGEKIKTMDMNALEVTRKKLVGLNDVAEKSEQSQLIAELLHNLTVRGFEVAKSSKDASNVKKADRAMKFAQETYASITKLSGLSADLKEEYAARAEGFKPGSFERVSLLGDISPDHPEFLEKLADSQRAQNKLLGEWMTYCSPQARAYAGTFTLCARAESEYRAGMVGFNQLQNVYSSTHAQDYSFLAQGAGANANTYGSNPTANLMQNGANGMPMMMNQQQNPAVKPLTSAYSDFVNPYIYQGVIAQNNQPVANAMPGQQVLQNHSPQPTIMLQ